MCNVVRWAYVEHCLDCGCCVEKIDHHCPWSSKCITSKNMSAFYGFVATTPTFFVISFIQCMASAFFSALSQFGTTKTK